ncbi:TerB family tellurite resistance protein [Saccharospirillum impatiens]|uniref:tellurite resistance TerB family protein n=1 Tax=Saccharospirillum impatiens TaxID=169438 RepID=UPI00040E4AF3|nr:TerB family tellurite resistance protein [Saccharospirillum impatiens]
MLSKIMAWFDAPEEPIAELTVDEAITVLMVEIMMSDHDLDAREQAAITERLVERTGEPREVVQELVSRAQQTHSDSHDLFQFTKLLNEQLNVDEKMTLVVDLWRTALADGVIDKHEDHMIRRLSDLLYLHHSHFIKAKHQALEAD